MTFLICGIHVGLFDEGISIVFDPYLKVDTFANLGCCSLRLITYTMHLIASFKCLIDIFFSRIPNQKA